MFETPLLIDQHIHGGFGVDFNTAKVEEIIEFADKALARGIGGFFPTLVTDTVENIKRQIKVIKKAAEDCDSILGIHLEGIFINPEKCGIHNPEWCMPLTVDNYKQIEDDFIKIVTLAPELDEGLIDYLKSKGVKVQAGHCVTGKIENADGVTHTFNAMSGITHRGESTALSALIYDDIYAEIIADGIHVSDDAFILFIKSKPLEKILLVSDALPITGSAVSKSVFAGSRILYDGKVAISPEGVIAGSTTMLDTVVKRLNQMGLFHPMFIENPYIYHGIQPKGKILWDENWDIVEIKAL